MAKTQITSSSSLLLLLTTLLSPPPPPSVLQHKTCSPTFALLGGAGVRALFSILRAWDSQLVCSHHVMFSPLSLSLSGTHAGQDEPGETLGAS